MSIPILAPRWISVGGNHLHSEEIEQQQGRVTFRAVTTQTDGAAKEIAVRAATLADAAFTTARARYQWMNRSIDG